jgi:hypothetical protein
VASIAQIHKKTKEASDQNADVYWQIRGINELVFANKDDEFDAPLIPNYTGKMLGNWLGNDTQLLKSNGRGERLYESILTPALPMIKRYLMVDSALTAEVIEKVVTMSAMVFDNPCPLSDRGTCDNGMLTRDYVHKGEKHNAGGICPACNAEDPLEKLKPAGTYNTMAQPVAYTKKTNGVANTGAMPMPYYQNIDASVVATEALVKELGRLEVMMYDAMGMKWEIQTPIIQSGIAKQLDREPSTRWLRNAARWIIGKKMNWGIDTELMLRWGPSVGYSLEKLNELKPSIRIPTQFDIYDAKYTLEEITEVYNSGFGAEFVASYHLSYAKKRWGEDSDQYQSMLLEKQLKPFFGYKLADVQKFVEDGIATKADYEVYVNFGKIIQLLPDGGTITRDDVYRNIQQLVRDMGS